MQAAPDHLHSLIQSAAARVGEGYFQLPVAGADAAYRERAYCYELYHQLRCLWDGFPSSLGGEIDKSRHPRFARGPSARSEPDFLVHNPGDMEHNLAGIEVKAATVGRRGIRADLMKLSWYCQEAQYFRGILLLYGDRGASETLAARVRQAPAPDVDFTQTDCVYHRRVGQRPDRLQP